VSFGASTGGDESPPSSPLIPPLPCAVLDGGEGASVVGVDEAVGHGLSFAVPDATAETARPCSQPCVLLSFATVETSVPWFPAWGPDVDPGVCDFLPCGDVEPEPGVADGWCLNGL
jgi:hypothetical protein